MCKGMKKVISTLIGVVIGGIGGAIVVGKNASDENTKLQHMSNKHLALFQMMNEWVKVKQEGKNLASYFEKNSYKKIAIYGMSFAGERLLDELRDTSVEVAYGIDKRATSLFAEVNIVSMDDKLLENVDAVVVTAITFFDEIEEELSKRLSCPIISLEDILYEV